MNSFDRPIIEFINGYSQKSWLFDKAVNFINGTNLAKGGIFLAIIWALWFERNGEEAVAENRKTLLATLAGSFLALFIVRFLAATLPFRYRPMHQPGLDFLPPIGSPVETLDGWSSFPSDHAALFAGLAIGIFLVSRYIGLLSILYALLVILIPRIYRGLHYPTDILAGIPLGCVCVLLMNGSMIRKKLADPLLGWSEKYPRLFYGAFFLVSYQTATLFEDVRHIAKFLLGKTF